MIAFSFTLHLPSQAKHENLSTKSSDPYSFTRSALSSTVARHSSKIVSHKTHTAKGEPTKYGLIKGYIQASPYYPKTELSICLENDKITVQGKTESGQYLNREFKKLKDARRFLKETH